MFVVLLFVWIFAYAFPIKISVAHWLEAILAPLIYGGLWGSLLYALLGATSIGTVGPLVHDYIRGKHVTLGAWSMIGFVVCVWVFFGAIVVLGL